MLDNDEYWIARHAKLAGSLASVGNIGSREDDNRRRYARKKRRLVDLLRSIGHNQLSGKTALDAGCGTGDMSEILYALGATVYGVDASPLAVMVASDRAAPDDDGRTQFRQGSLPSFDFEQSFDLVLCLDVLYHIVDNVNWMRAVRNLATHVSEGGHLVILEKLRDEEESPAPHVHFRTIAQYTSLLGDCGMRVLENAPKGFLIALR